MIDPTKITDYKRTDSQLEEFALFTIAVAGKNATTTAKNLERLLQFCERPKWTPFEIIRSYRNETHPRSLELTLKEFGFGCYQLKAKGFSELVDSGLDLRTCTAEDLEKISGIGMKTSRFFLLHSRRDANVSCLDTHVLSYLRDHGYEVPKTTPQSKKLYYRIEQDFMSIVKRSKKGLPI